ncbi:flagellin [Curtobacterium sp. MCSS17_016]|uniref:flagellin N-terminal helical domain-containing protein n=1 Tax=Curtobacterium sp. MCSS17_016 TaxID=2175644 RepID=UPI000DAA5D0C|nr:flagellin [Curtobacterium sp. MCSS17_016]WIE80920.1 flagellin [Curtobacterium sp. MCSS17_016]
MAMTINTNLSANQVLSNLNSNQDALRSSMQKLSTGSRINTAADDAAGLAISQGLQSQIGGLTTASRNTQNGINLIQTASGALTQVSSILQTVRDLAVQASNDTNNTDSRTDIQTQVTQLAKELTRIAGSTNFNGINLLDGSAGAGADGKLNLQVGAGASATNDVIQVDLSGANVTDVATAVSALTFDSTVNSQAAITALDTQIQNMSTAQATLGATQNRLQSTQQSLAVNTQNLTAAKSTISDTDMASEMANFTSKNVLVQAGAAMLSQANQQSQQVLKLLQG